MHTSQKEMKVKSYMSPAKLLSFTGVTIIEKPLTTMILVYTYIILILYYIICIGITIHLMLTISNED